MLILECDCNKEGSTSNTCSSKDGQCPCKTNVDGKTCSACKPDCYGFPNCTGEWVKLS